MLIDTLGGSLLGNMLARANERTIRVGQDF